MPDSFYIDIGQSIKSSSDQWYDNVQVLGAGGNAITFLVLCTSGPERGNLFALKIFKRLSEDNRKEKFLREAEFLQGFEHPAIMRVYDDGVFVQSGNEFPFVVAEYLPYTLDEKIKANDSSIAEKLSFSLQLLSAINYISKLDPPVVHRDIKPRNIFVKGRSCVLGDFGLMKVLDGDEEVDRDVFKESVGPGMPFFYRTPDLIEYGKEESHITPKSDVFQLGLVLAELFTGRNPAVAPEEDHFEPIELESLNHIKGSLGPPIAQLILSMLEEDPAERPSAEALIDQWRTYFSKAVEQSHQLEGRVF